MPLNVSGCATDRVGVTTDCVARGLPPGASVILTIDGVAYTFLPPVDAAGDVWFWYGQPDPGSTLFIARAGGKTTRFVVDFR